MAVFLLGNGINQLEGVAPGWEALVQGVQERLHIKEPFCDGGREVSMTLGFERFVLKAMGQDRTLRDITVKKEIARSLKDHPVPADWGERESIHRDLLRRGVTDILTTNYDYLLECAGEAAFQPKPSTSETMYSMRRCQHVSVDGQAQRIWHIHGELRAPRSICLGFEQYAGSLQRIRSWLTETVPHGFRLRQILAGEGDGETAQHWCHLFFTQDVHIIGFGLDFSETDIWWLLNYRARAMLTGELTLGNRIFFYDTDGPTSSPYRRDLLDAFQVEQIPCPGDTYPQRYRRLRDRLSENL